MTRLNAELPPDVRVRDLQVVSSDFAAMSNLWKRYVYTIPPSNSSSAAARIGARTRLQSAGSRPTTIAMASMVMVMMVGLRLIVMLMWMMVLIQMLMLLMMMRMLM